MVPITRDNLLINQFKKWNLPVILCARTGLGTINHTLLSLEALWARDIKVQGLVFIGEPNDDNIQTIADFSGARILGHVPVMDTLDAESLQYCFERNFRRKDFV